MVRISLCTGWSRVAPEIPGQTGHLDRLLCSLYLSSFVIICIYLFFLHAVFLCCSFLVFVILVLFCPQLLQLFRLHGSWQCGAFFCLMGLFHLFISSIPFISCSLALDSRPSDLSFCGFSCFCSGVLHMSYFTALS